MSDDAPAEQFLKEVPLLLWEAFGVELDSAPSDWAALKALFRKGAGLFDRPVILFLDEFHALPRGVIDRLANVFRDLYHKREAYLLHGVALIGMPAVLGVESPRGTPFNVQRFLHIPNLTENEVAELFHQYQEEFGQTVEPAMVAEVYRVTRGQPGLVGWFGELLTGEKHNPHKDQPLGMAIWRRVYGSALLAHREDTTLSHVIEACGEYRTRVLDLFARAHMPFRLETEWCSYLYSKGIIDSQATEDERSQHVQTCRFSSPFVQERLYNALTDDLFGEDLPIPALDPQDNLEGVLAHDAIDLAALLERYEAFLVRLAARGLDPWKEQPRRTDLRLTEAVGHLHLYAWLQAAIGRRCIIRPEFPTGNGKVDLHIRHGDKQGIIEVKSFVDFAELESARRKAAHYATSLGLDRVTIAVFVPVSDPDVLEKLSGQIHVDGAQVVVVAIGWDTTPRP